MNKFRVFVKDKFDVVFDTIEKARECRKALKQLKYEGIEIIVTQEDLDPRCDGWRQHPVHPGG